MQKFITNLSQRLGWVFSSGIIILAISAWAYIYYGNVFPIKTVKVANALHFIAPQALQEMVMPNVRKGFFAVDVATIQDQILAQPGVKAVSVRKVWPATVIIDIKEYQPIAHWGAQSFISQSGQIFTPSIVKNISTTLPRFIAPVELSTQLIQFYQTYLPQFAKFNLKMLKITVNQQHSWVLQLDNGMQLLLGRQHLDQHMQRFFTAYPKIFAGRGENVLKVDLRYANGLAVKWQQ